MTDQTAPNVPDHENPAWLREHVEHIRRHTYVPAVAAALSLLADVIDVCNREDVIVLPPNRAMRGVEWTLWRRNELDPGAHGPTLHAAVRAFRAAEQEARNVSP